MPNTTHRAVAHMTGSLPMGGQVMNTHVFAFHHTPDGLGFNAQTALNPSGLTSAWTACWRLKSVTC